MVRLTRRALRAILFGSVIATTLVAAGGASHAEDASERHLFVTSFDGTQLRVNFFRATGLPADDRAPVVLIAHGFGEAGPADPDAPRLAGAPTLRPLLDAGYNVVTWDARGHGASGGTAMLDSPDFEVRDVQVLLTWIAAQPEVQVDGTDDPRVGMVGASYGGIIQFLAAAIDQRIDVIAPGYTANDLADVSLATNGKFKEGWGLALSGMTAANLPSGLASPLGPQLHTLDPAAVTHVTASVAAGETTPGLRDYLASRSPHNYLSRITQPTLIQGGTSDTLFPLENLVKDYLAVRRNGVPTKMVWNCEGHSLCAGDAGPLTEHFDNTVIAWMDRWLKRDSSIDTGRQFEWIADNETKYRSAPVYPTRERSRLAATGSGQLPLAAQAPLSSPGFVFLGAQPAAAPAVTVDIPPPAEEADVVGFPTLTLTYSGLAAPGQTWIYAQVLDKGTGRVVGVQVTPVKLSLDGSRHTVTMKLNAIATRATPDSRYQLQLIPGSLVFGLQRSSGVVNLHSVGISLPVL